MPVILVVDDDDLLRDMMAAVLAKRAPQRVLAADGAEVALRLLDGNPSIRLLVTDVEMPGQDGVALAAAARARRPGIQVLYVTGGAAPRVMAADPHAPLLHKPWRAGTLLAVADWLLASPATDSPSGERPMTRPPRDPDDRRRHLRVRVDGPAHVRLPGGNQIDARLLDLSEGGVRLAVGAARPDLSGRWLVVSGPSPLQHGYDARVIAARGEHLHLAFDHGITSLGVLRSFIAARAGQPGA